MIKLTSSMVYWLASRPRTLGSRVQTQVEALNFRNTLPAIKRVHTHPRFKLIL